MPEAENYALPGATNDSWRAWLTMGVRRSPADRRRLRGEYRGLKRMLLEGMTNGGERPHAWKDFSGAMIRHAVDDAMRSLPAQDKRVVKLAYFGGYSNREIAKEVGLTEATVQRRLRRALSAISEHIQHGRALSRRAALALAVWLSGRWLSDGGHHLAQAAVVASATVIVVAQPAAPAVLRPASPQPAAVSSTSARSVPTGSPAIPGVQPTAVTPTVKTPPVQLPVDVPALPSPPVKIKLPQI
jgi:DNA-directed RNA polymerase specialized sigma24 family protein